MDANLPPKFLHITQQCGSSMIHSTSLYWFILFVVFSTANNAALSILAFMFMWCVSQSGNPFWVTRCMQFLFTQITFTKGWNSYFHCWSCVRGPPSYQHQTLISCYCSTRLMSFIHILFFSLFSKEEVDLPRYKSHVIDARDDSNTLTKERAERWVRKGAQMKGLEKVKDGGCLIGCKSEEYSYAWE